ncbi:MAG TPA: S53 family peptidase [Ktedonobacterales bacterium]|nr:S53 family peptidase [Ktedonobacterales bacterium]
MKSISLRRMLSRTCRHCVYALAGSALLLAWLVGVAPKVGAASNGSSDPQDPSVALVTSTVAPPTEAQCNAIGRRCFNPAAMAGSYDYAGLHASGIDGRGTTIALVDSFGSATVASDLNNFDSAFNLQHLCGEANYTCQPGDPTFKILNVQGTPPTTPPPPNNGTGQEAHNLWAIEVSLDVEWAHATAPMANILLVTTPTAETLGVQGFAQFMNAEQYVIDHHMADVISQSFGAGEGSFHNGLAALQNLRQPFISAQANHVTVLASSGDSGTANIFKEPVKNPALIPYPSVGWPASDPLVTAVGGTYLCTDTTTGTTVDTSLPPTSRCAAGNREVGWIASGGGYSILFPRPAYQNTLPPGSTFVGSSVGAPGPNSNMRGVPDVAYQASAITGVLVYDAGEGGWFVVGGTSCGSPQWAGLVAMADQLKGSDVGFINPALYSIANNPAKYAADFHDVTTGNNQLNPLIPGYSASTGWDAVTGLGSPDAAHLLPDLVAAS